MYMQLLTSYVYRKLDHLAAYAASSTTNSLHLAMAELFFLKLITCECKLEQLLPLYQHSLNLPLPWHHVCDLIPRPGF